VWRWTVIIVKIFGTLGLDLGRSVFESDLAGGTLADVIDQMASRFGAKVKEELLDKEGNLDSAYGVFSNEEMLADLTTQVQDGAELVIINMAGGG